MTTESADRKQRRCPVCGRGKLLRRYRSERYEFDDSGTIVWVETKDVPLEYCDRCGEILIGLEASRNCHDALGRAVGLLTPAEITAIRELAGLSPADFAAKIGVDEELYRRWERGRAWQDRVADNYLRLYSQCLATTMSVKFEKYGSGQSEPNLAVVSGGSQRIAEIRRGRAIETD